MGNIYVSKSQYMRACSVDLADYLLKNHPNAVINASGSVLLRADRHVSVKHGYHGYKNWATDETGNNVDYLMYFLGYDYPAAVLALTGDANGRDFQEDETYIQPTKQEKKQQKKIKLPEKADNYKRIFAYLQNRGIPADMIQRLINQKILYQSKLGNCVFTNPQLDYCEIRGTNTYADRRCKYRDECSKYTSGLHQWCTQMQTCEKYKPDPFHRCLKSQPDRFWYFTTDKGKLEKVFVCEAAIDAVSLYLIRQKLKIADSAAFVSIGGVANQQTINRLKQHKNVIIATDNDKAGNDCRTRNADLETLTPKAKDWNADLMEMVQHEH